MSLNPEIADFFKRQNIAIASTIDKQGNIHCAIKEVVGVKPDGDLLLFDLYCNRTYENLKNDPRISVTALSEKEFKGYTIQGKARIIPRSEVNDEIISEREKKIVQRISARLISSVKSDLKSRAHFEAELPAMPKYLIEVSVDKVVDLSPPKFEKDCL
ncbi:MAG: pyridoxamine 5'-phosphate oxidase family protein [Candidatus Omnitrophica bacterium]|nr:pyridoxamine 5'-phosphate oxidase family protein [Candidatus Omnitrophota bacterium]